MKRTRFRGRVPRNTYVPAKYMRKTRTGICSWCQKGVTVRPMDEPFGPCCGEPTGLWTRKYPTPWKKAR